MVGHASCLKWTNVSGGGIERRQSSIAFVRSDAHAIGRLAARELLKQGPCRSFGYAGYRDDCDWSRDRGNAFRDELAKVGSSVNFFDQAHYPNKIDDRKTLAAWLRDLPKPCGILAACDDRVFELLDACREIDLRVPSEAVVLGVNKVSYSLLNLRFQELQRESVYEAILRTRLNAVKDRLVTTNETIDEIAARFGWA